MTWAQFQCGLDSTSVWLESNLNSTPTSIKSPHWMGQWLDYSFCFLESYLYWSQLKAVSALLSLACLSFTGSVHYPALQPQSWGSAYICRRRSTCSVSKLQSQLAFFTRGCLVSHFPEDAPKEIYTLPGTLVSTRWAGRLDQVHVEMRKVRIPLNMYTVLVSG